MSIPAGVVVATLQVGGDTGYDGDGLTSVSVTVKPSADVIWKANGQRLIAWPLSDQAVNGASATVATPVVNQVGFKDDSGRDFQWWEYDVTVVLAGPNGTENLTKKWQPLAGQSTVKFNDIPSGQPQPALSSPFAVVTSVNGETGDVTVSGGGTGADPNAVHYTAETTTLAQRAQAQANLGLAAPCEFRPEDYGAKGDGQLAHDAATNGTNTFTSASMAGKCSVGQWVMIQGGRGTTDTAAIGTITAVSGSSVTIDTTARGLSINATATGLDVLWGTDDTAAINAAGAAAKSYAEAHNYVADVVFSDRIYVVSGLTQSNDGNIAYNTSIPVPRPTDNNGRKLVIGYRGVQRASHSAYWNSTTINLAGTVIVSTQFGPNTVDATYGFQSVFGAGIPQNSGNMAQALDPGHSNPVFVNHKPVFTNIQVLTPVYSNTTVFDWRYSSGVYFDGLSACGFANDLYGGGVVLFSIWNSSVFAGKNGCGYRMPLAGNNADTVGGDIEIIGIPLALSTPSEHTTIGTLKAINVGVVLDITASTSGHGLVISRVTAEAYQGGIRNAVTAASGKVPIFVGQWNTETSATAAGGGGYDVYDPNNSLVGEVNWADTVDAGHAQPIVTGGNNVRIVNVGSYRGVQTPPAVPATTVALQNPFWRDATVRITGGTVSSIVVGSTTVATATGATVRVPTGKTITLTYTGTPAWTWELD